MSLPPAAYVDPSRRQVTVEPFLPAESIGPTYPSPAVVPPAHSGGQTTDTPLSTIVALTVTSVVIFVAFALFVVYRVQKFKLEEMNRRYKRQGMTGEAWRHRWPGDLSLPDLKESCGSQCITDPKHGFENLGARRSVRFPPDRRVRARVSISESSSESSSGPETCSCDVFKGNLPAYPGAIQPHLPRYPPRIQKPPGFYPKTSYSGRSRWYTFPNSQKGSIVRDSGHSRDPLGPHWRTRGTVGTRRSRGIDPSHHWPPISSPNELRNSKPWSQSSPDIFDGRGFIKGPYLTPPFSAPATVFEGVSDEAPSLPRNRSDSMPSVDLDELNGDFGDMASSYTTQSASRRRSERSYPTTLISGLDSGSVRQERPNFDVHSPFGRLSPTGPIASDISAFQDNGRQPNIEVDSIGSLEMTAGKAMGYNESSESEGLYESMTDYDGMRADNEWEEHGSSTEENE